MFRLLFLCTGPSGRSLMAAAFAEQAARRQGVIVCAGNVRQDVNPIASEVMEEVGLTIPTRIEIGVDQIVRDQFDIVVTLCNVAYESCPTFPGAPARLHWPLIDPSKPNYAGRDVELAAYRTLRDEIHTQVSNFFQLGFLDSVLNVRRTFGSLLDHLTDGVMAHDIERRIYFFNPAAQAITGVSYADAIGKDCHEVFPGRFCGGDCAFCGDARPIRSTIRYPQSYLSPDGSLRDLEMSAVTTDTPEGDVTGALVIFRDITDAKRLKQRFEASQGFCGIIGRHPSMLRLYAALTELADVTFPIIIQGESGVGKELAAQALHKLSRKSSGAFVPTNCGALPEGTIESELFGHVKGAFTGAIRNKKGRFELADGGTIFLDEIGEVSPAVQVKLLRALQDNSFLAVGGEKPISVDVRVICASNKDLKQLTQQGLFRDDLYYRIAVMPLTIPPLHERRSDIPLLVEHFLQKFSASIGRPIPGVKAEAMVMLMNYSWPGNVRELSNAVQYAMIKSHGREIESVHLPPEISDIGNSSISNDFSERRVTTAAVRKALDDCEGVRSHAAKKLGISRMTLYRYLRDLGM